MKHQSLRLYYQYYKDNCETCFFICFEPNHKIRKTYFLSHAITSPLCDLINDAFIENENDDTFLDYIINGTISNKFNELQENLERRINNHNNELDTMNHEWYKSQKVTLRYMLFSNIKNIQELHRELQEIQGVVEKLQKENNEIDTNNNQELQQKKEELQQKKKELKKKNYNKEKRTTTKKIRRRYIIYSFRTFKKNDY